MFDEASKNLGPWAWGPKYDLTSTALKDAVTASATLSDALETTQTTTVDGLEKLGLDIKE
ncbi:hypothetical protein QFZ53_000679 [Microbacterium natoriense]|uniref:Uncharacterized protein n=1 Tax=Microbacterium natoriense TaxID=284570 RepID=A0AAW8ESK2_9MICO|nr:hypothetical protein [Microbacterium natoriense]MDQ0646483.1 hypothetical protein [Microbacterium natoriense]